MPLVYVTLAEGTTSQDQRPQIGDGIYRALIDVANVPEDDRFQVINEVRSANLIYSPDYMGFDVARRSCSFRSSSTPAGPWTSSRRCTRESPKSRHGRCSWRRYCHQPRRGAQGALVFRAR
jgi:phenylpyruvate tautomerase PptA (4-oxalocrotonate tautomerase family)